MLIFQSCVDKFITRGLTPITIRCKTHFYFQKTKASFVNIQHLTVTSFLDKKNEQILGGDPRDKTGEKMTRRAMSNERIKMFFEVIFPNSSVFCSRGAHIINCYTYINHLYLYICPDLRERMHVCVFISVDQFPLFDTHVLN